MIAAWKGLNELVTFLLSQGANKEATDSVYILCEYLLLYNVHNCSLNFYILFSVGQYSVVIGHFDE